MKSTYMNNSLPNLKTVKGFFNSNKVRENILEALSEFFNRMPSDFLVGKLDKVNCIDMANTSYEIYDVEDNPKKEILIGFGDFSDLQHSSIVGLIAHLFALIQINKHDSPIPKGEEWLKVDLYSDEVAKGWGFKNEIENLREIRPQKIPSDVKYPDIVIDNSVSNEKFNMNLRSVLSKMSKSLPDGGLLRNKVWYIDKYSMICNLYDLRRCGTEFLHVFTIRYTKEDTDKLLGRMSVSEI